MYIYCIIYTTIIISIVITTKEQHRNTQYITNKQTNKQDTTYVYVYIYIYIYIHMFIVCVYIYIYIYLYMYMCICIHPVSITRFPLSRLSPGARVLRNPFVYTINAKTFQGLGPKRRESCNGDRVYSYSQVDLTRAGSARRGRRAGSNITKL